MSIELTGPKSYEFQYLLSLYVTLKNLQAYHEKLACYIEKTGTEDMELTIKNTNDTKSIEIQVKNENRDIDEIKLAKWLCHYKERDSQDSILNRLLKNKNKLFIIATSGRCSDSIKDFISGNRNFDKKGTIHKNNIRKITNAISDVEKKATTTLKKARNVTNKLLVSCQV